VTRASPIRVKVGCIHARIGKLDGAAKIVGNLPEITARLEILIVDDAQVALT
jgi:hypothetical protein